MRKLFGIVLLFFSFVFSGCPVGIPYSLGIKNTEKFQDDLSGVWVQTKPDMEVMQMEIKKLNKYTIQITVLERGSMFMEEVNVFKGWFTEINGKKFIYVQNESENGQYYAYSYSFDKNVLYTSDFSLLIGGTDVCTSTESYREEVKASMEKPEFLGEITQWNKK